MPNTFPADFARAVIRQGKVLDAPTPDFIVLFPTTSTSELWATPTAIDPSDATDYTPDKVLFPHPGEMKFRVLEFNPAPADAVSDDAVDEMLSSGGGSGTRGDLHRTMSTDYFVVLSGRITLMSEDGVVDLEPGDTAICLGGMHGWVCRTSESARIFSVLVGAENFGEDGSEPFRAALAAVPGSESAVRRVILGHNPDGRAAILSDQHVRVPAQLWSSDSTPNNVVRGDRGSNGLEQPDPQGTRFLIDDLATGETHRLPNPQGQVLGVVVNGRVRLQGGSESASLHLATHDTFIIVGSDASVIAHEGPVRIALVALAGSELSRRR